MRIWIYYLVGSVPEHAVLHVEIVHDGWRPNVVEVALTGGQRAQILLGYGAQVGTS